MPLTPSSILSLDVGQKRIGVALSSDQAGLAAPLTTLQNDDTFVERLQQLVEDYGVHTIVVGLPRGLNGQDTPQTEYVHEYVEGLRTQVDANIVLQDEAVTSAKAEDELKARRKAYTKEDIDALSATYILEDYLGGN